MTKIECMHDAFVYCMWNHVPTNGRVGGLVDLLSQDMADYLEKHIRTTHLHHVALLEDCTQYLIAGAPFGIEDDDATFPLSKEHWEWYDSGRDRKK